MDINDPRLKTLHYRFKVHAYAFGRIARHKQYFIPELLGAVIAVALAAWC